MCEGGNPLSDPNTTTTTANLPPPTTNGATATRTQQQRTGALDLLAPVQVLQPKNDGGGGIVEWQTTHPVPLTPQHLGTLHGVKPTTTRGATTNSPLVSFISAPVLVGSFLLVGGGPDATLWIWDLEQVNGFNSKEASAKTAVDCMTSLPPVWTKNLNPSTSSSGGGGDAIVQLVTVQENAVLAVCLSGTVLVLQMNKPRTNEAHEKGGDGKGNLDSICTVLQALDVSLSCGLRCCCYCSQRHMLFFGWDQGVVEAHELLLAKDTTATNTTNHDDPPSYSWSTQKRWQCDGFEQSIYDLAILPNASSRDQSTLLMVKTRTALHVLDVNRPIAFTTDNRVATSEDPQCIPLQSLAVLPEAGREIVWLSHPLDQNPASSHTNNTINTMPMHCTTTTTNVATAVGLADGMVALLTVEPITTQDITSGNDDDNNNAVVEESPCWEWGVSSRRDQILLPFPSLVGMGSITYNHVSYIACCLRGTSTYLIPQNPDGDASPPPILGLSLPHDTDQDAMIMRVLQGFAAFDWNGIPLLIYLWPGGILDIYSCGILPSTCSSSCSLSPKEAALIQALLDNGTAQDLRSLLLSVDDPSILKENKGWSEARSEILESLDDFHKVLVEGNAFRSLLLQFSS